MKYAVLYNVCANIIICCIRSLQKSKLNTESETERFVLTEHFDNHFRCNTFSQVNV